MTEFFKEYKEKSKDEFDKSKSLIVELTYHIEDMERKFNILNDEIKKRKG